MITIDLDEAARRFGPLLDPKTRTYRFFTDPETGGDWRPTVQAGAGVTGYSLFPPPRDSPRTRWRPHSRPSVSQRDRKT